MPVTKASSRSVLLLDSDPHVLAVLTSVLEGSRSSNRPKIRVLRARTLEEAAEVLGRPYVPVDLIVSNSNFGAEQSENIADCARGVRPGVPVMYMESVADDTTVRIHTLRKTTGEEPAIDRAGLLQAVVAAFETPAFLTAGGN